LQFGCCELLVFFITLDDAEKLQFAGSGIQVAVKPVCMGFEDYFAAFSADSDPSLSVGPCAGRMDRRGGEPTFLEVSCAPNGKGGQITGDLVINLPEDNSKICYKVIANSV
jgi:hypothetical protein